MKENNMDAQLELKIRNEAYNAGLERGKEISAEEITRLKNQNSLLQDRLAVNVDKVEKLKGIRQHGDVTLAIKNAYQFLCSPTYAEIEGNFDFNLSEVIETLIVSCNMDKQKP